MKDAILKLKEDGKTYNEIKKILGCAISTISYHCNKNGKGTDKKLSDELILKIKDYYLTHTLIETSEVFDVSIASVKKYCDNKRIILTTNERKKNRVNSVTKRRRNLKIIAVKYKGGCCKKCGYDKCIGALEFHHLDPTQKDFGISQKGTTRSWEKIKIELDKCIMVCSNCHREIHEDLNKNTESLP